jgi:hypothetical protein
MSTKYIRPKFYEQNKMETSSERKRPRKTSEQLKPQLGIQLLRRIWRVIVRGQPGKKVTETPSQPISWVW